MILTVALWLAALSPARAGTGPTPAPAGRDPIRIGVGVGGELIDLISPADHDEDEGDEDNGDSLLDGLVDLLIGNGDDDDEDSDGVVTRVVEILFGEESDSVGSGPVVSATVVPEADLRPADDDGVVGEVLELLEDDEIGALEDILDFVEDTVEFVLVSVGDNQVVALVCQVRHALHSGILVIPPIGGATPPVCVP